MRPRHGHVGKMVVMNANGSPPRRGLGAVLHPPLWARWLLTIAAFAVLIAVVAIVVHNLNHETGGSGSPASETKAEAEANREGQIVIEQDQAPHTAGLRLHAGITVAAALEHAIADDVHARIDNGQLTGPLQSIRCRPAGATSSEGRRPYRCTVRSAGIAYPFLAVANSRSGRLTWCKVDPPPTPGLGEVPVSADCRA